MKRILKYYLSRQNILPILELLRHTPNSISWIKSGTSGIAPPPIKRLIIKSYIERYKIQHFLETGTYLGDTLAQVASNPNIQCISIELAESYFLEAINRFSNYQNVNLLNGDSGVLIPKIVEKLQHPTLFWLDGHYSGGVTAKSDKETPIIKEIEAILNSSNGGHVVLIDDVRCFNGTHDYPHIDDLLRLIRNDGRYSVEISADILRMTPLNFVEQNP